MRLHWAVDAAGGMFGASAFGGGDWALGWGQQDDADSMASIHRALDAGIAAKADTHDPEPVQATRRVVVVEGQAFEIVFDGVVSHGT